MKRKSNLKSDLTQLEDIAGAVAAGAAPGDLERRIAELERWRDRIWRDPRVLAMRLAELLDSHQRELAWITMIVTGAALAILDHDHNLDGIRDHIHL